jgi:hypothetical protein
MSSDEEFTDKSGRLRSSKAPAGSLAQLLQVRNKQLVELRPGLTDDEFSGAVGYVNTYLGDYSVDQIVALVDAIREARSRLRYLTDVEFVQLRKMVQISGHPSLLADELVMGIEALRPRSPARRLPGAPRLSYEDREHQLREAIDTLAGGLDAPTHDAIAEALGKDPRTLRRWLSEYPELERWIPKQSEPTSQNAGVSGRSSSRDETAR